MTYPLLDKIDSPADVKKLSIKELKQLCAEIRAYMVEVCAVNPGHLGSSLGAVELIVGLHYVTDTPKDKIVFDVGHQAYAHKIITGRREAFRRNRCEDGISGFPKMSESEYDAFGTGHSSTSISAALGLAEAARMKGIDEKVTAFIGDGSLTGGLAYEGLNNVGDSAANILVLLNDNDHSIDDNRGAVHKHLLRITTSRKYNSFKSRIWNLLGESRIRHFLQRWIRSLKSWFVKKTGGDLFEALGFRYFGPIDGNDIEDVINTLRKLKNIGGPKILHAITVKGKGYPAAEADPTTWHAPGRFDPATGERMRPNYKADRYQDVFGQVLCELADKDERVVGITPAMASGCGMSIFAKRHSERFYDVGIEEEHAVTFSAGLAAGGLKPFCNIYSAFSQRAYDQIIHDVAMQELPVCLCFDRAGLVGEDGATHHGIFDMAAYRSIPGAIVSSPRNEIELKRLMYTALGCNSGPFIIRYPRGCGEGADWKNAPVETYEIGQAEEILKGSRVAVIAIGHPVGRALEAAEKVGDGLVGVYNFRFLKPLDEQMLEKITSSYKAVLTVEDGSLKGGLFGAVSEWCAIHSKHCTLRGIGIGDEFVAQSSQERQRQIFRLDADGIAVEIKSLL
ncbi:MAG: 1-deoxy-D-xylulose-5-phosphate synthase [Bacteroidales bacterium]|nr:1-deoxy-D-xylulose-5-phosphate synthase [Bacteroidales bacterium]